MATTAKRVTKGKKNTSTPRTKAKKKARPAPSSTRRPTPELDGWITHTDLASNDPPATQAWTQKVLGWKFSAPMKTPNGDMFFFTYSDKGGGAIRANNPPEIPGSIPYIQVPDCRKAYDKALAEGAEEMMSPTRVMDTVTVAIVRAPGGVPVGLSGP